jgi:hypothetical protein
MKEISPYVYNKEIPGVPLNLKADLSQNFFRKEENHGGG